MRLWSRRAAGDADLFGPYRLGRRLGAGAMGEVHEGYDTVRERLVAVKRMSAEARGEELADRFRRESRIAARLDSPHVIPIHDFGVIDDRLFIDMRLVRGADLGAVLKRDGPFDADRAVTVTAQIADALDAAHEAGLVHRDVKPSNMLVSHRRDQDFVYLADFGIVHVREASRGDRITRSGHTLGSPAYMAPEQVSAGPFDHRLDVYALGCVLFEMVTGRPPFTGDSLAVMYGHLHSEPPAPSTVRAADANALDDVVLTALAKEPGQRFDSAGSLAAAALAAVRRSAPRPSTPPVSPLSGPTAGLQGLDDVGPTEPESESTTVATPRVAASTVVPITDVPETTPDEEPARSVPTLVPERADSVESGSGDDATRAANADGPSRQGRRRRAVAAVSALAIVAAGAGLAVDRWPSAGAPGAAPPVPETRAVRLAVDLSASSERPSTLYGSVYGTPTPSPDGRRLYVPTFSGVSIFDTTTDRMLPTPAPFVFYQAEAATPTSDGRRLWADSGTGGLYGFDAATGAPMSTIKLGQNPPSSGYSPTARAIALSPDGQRAYVIVEHLPLTGALQVVNLTSQPPALLSTIPLPLYPGAVAISRDGRKVAATVFRPDRSRELFVLDTSTGATRSIPIPLPLEAGVASLALNTDGSRATVFLEGERGAAPAITVDTVQGGATAMAADPSVVPLGGTVTPDGARMLLAGCGPQLCTLTVRDTATGAPVGTAPIPDAFYKQGSLGVDDSGVVGQPADVSLGVEIAVLPDGRHAYLTPVQNMALWRLDLPV